MPDTTIKVVLNASAETVQVGERAWLDCIVVGDANAKIEFSKDDADALPENAQVRNIVEFFRIVFAFKQKFAGNFLSNEKNINRK